MKRIFKNKVFQWAILFTPIVLTLIYEGELRRQKYLELNPGREATEGVRFATNHMVDFWLIALLALVPYVALTFLSF